MGDYIVARITLNGAGVTGLSPVCTVYDVSNVTMVLSSAAMTAVGNGIYKRDVTGVLDRETNYAGFVDAGTDNVDARQQSIDFSTNGLALEANIEDHLVNAMTSSLGAREVEITTRELSTGLPITDVFVCVYPQGQDLLIAYARTDETGMVSFGLDDGAYDVVLRKSAVSFTVPITLVVDGKTEAVYTGSALVIQSPNPTQNCRVYEYCFQQDGVHPLDAVVGKAKITSLPYDANSERLVEGTEIAGTYDPITGIVYWDIVRGATVQFTITVLGVALTKVIPDASSCRLIDLP